MSSSSKFAAMYLNEWPKEQAALTKLAITTCIEYDRRCALSENPNAPWHSKRGFPGFRQIHREVVDVAYERALALNFEGSRQRWAEFVFSHRGEIERAGRA